MVEREYIKIPLNSGLSLYCWLLEGYKREDFCELYSCIEYLCDFFDSGNYTELWSTRQIGNCLSNSMDESIRAGTAVYMVRVVLEWRPDITEGCLKEVLARLLKNMYSSTGTESGCRRRKSNVCSGCTVARRERMRCGRTPTTSFPSSLL